MLGLAVIGTGHWGRNHARVYKELLSEGMIDGLKICDADENRARQLSESLEVEYVTDYGDLIEDNGIQAVSIVTPSRTHYQLGKEFMETGKDVLVEKPLTMDVDEAKKLVEAADATGRILMVGHLFRYHPAVRELKHRIDAGEMGEIQNLIGNRLLFRVPRSDMGVIYALGIHELDLFCHLLDVDYPERLSASQTMSYGQNTEETASIFMDFGYAKGYAFESWLVAAYDRMRDLVVVGSKGSARVDYLNPQQLQLFDNRIVIEEGVPVRVANDEKHVVALPHAEPLKEELNYFISCVKSRQNPLTDGAVGLRSVVMAEAALQSARTGTAVELP